MSTPDTKEKKTEKPVKSRKLKKLVIKKKYKKNPC